MIDPNDISTVRVDELLLGAIGLTDLLPFETVIDQTLKQATFQDLVNFMAIHSNALQFEIKRMNVDQTYIDNNFDTTGLGINLCMGFAICNGNNGTTPMDGLVGVAYGTIYSSIGGFGGSKDAVLVSHSHGIRYQNHNASGSGSERVLDNSGSSTLIQNTDAIGESGTGKNMQPYIVQLYIMKL